MFGPLNVFRSLPEASSTHSATAQQSPQGSSMKGLCAVVGIGTTAVLHSVLITTCTLIHYTIIYRSQTSLFLSYLKCYSVAWSIKGIHLMHLCHLYAPQCKLGTLHIILITPSYIDFIIMDVNDNLPYGIRVDWDSCWLGEAIRIPTYWYR